VGQEAPEVEHLSLRASACCAARRCNLVCLICFLVHSPTTNTPENGPIGQRNLECFDMNAIDAAEPVHVSRSQPYVTRSTRPSLLLTEKT
jgi:hypothetical protein